MPNTRELSGLASDLGGYWGQEGSKDNGSGAKKKGGAKKKSTTTKKAATSNNLTAQPYTGGMTRKEAGFYEGDGGERVFLPRTALGNKVDQYLYWVFCEEEESNMCAYAATKEHKAEVEHLIENAAEVAAFHEQLNGSYMGSLSFFNGGRGTFGDSMQNGLKNKKGSAVQQLKAFQKWYAETDHYYGDYIEGLDWLIMKLDAKKPN